MFIQTQDIKDYIFPVSRVTNNVATNTSELKALIGTAFFFGQNGYALTAAHVIDQLDENRDPEKEQVAGIFNEADNWTSVTIEKMEKHPTEDVGIIKLTGNDWHSFLQITPQPFFSTYPYECWGYPHEVSNELLMLDEEAKPKPDLIFTQGYIRRRISRELFPTMIYRGTSFYELSETFGCGASGGPIILQSKRTREKWDIIGVYVGEKEKGNIGYASRSDSFFNWIPEILGISIHEESIGGKRG